MAADERSRKAATAIWPDFETRREEIVRVRSARLWADELHVFADGSHTLGERSAARDSLVVAWFRAHLGS